MTDIDDYQLADRMTADTGQVVLNGVQALVRGPLDQIRADRAAGPPGRASAEPSGRCRSSVRPLRAGSRWASVRRCGGSVAGFPTVRCWIPIFSRVEAFAPGWCLAGVEPATRGCSPLL